jgi:Secretion system C-terminal sorting domain
MLFALSHALAQNTIYVNQSATGLDNGTTWANAYTSLHTALGQSSLGDQVWVASGTYYPTTDTNRDIFFTLKNGVKLYGGFDGTESSVEDRDIPSHPTIISGDIGIIGDSTDNSYCLFYTKNPAAGIIIDGFYIRGGNADKNTNTLLFRSGPALLVEVEDGQSGLVIIQNSSIMHHACVGNGAVSIQCPLNNTNSNISVYIKDCLFEGNSTQGVGGGLFVYGKSLTEENVKIEGCTFLKNNAPAFSGGGIQVECSDILIDSCLFIANSARLFGGGVNIIPFGHDTCTTNMSNSRFIDNGAYNGGGLKMQPGVSLMKHIIINNNVFENNTGIPISALSTPLAAAFEIYTDFYDTVFIQVTNNLMRDNKNFYTFLLINSGFGKTIFSNNLLSGDRIYPSEISSTDTLIISGNLFFDNSNSPWPYNQYNKKRLFINNNVFYNNKKLHPSILQTGIISNNLFLNNTFASVDCFICNDLIDSSIILNNNIFWNNHNDTNTGNITWRVPMYNARAIFKNNIFDFPSTATLPSEWVIGSGNVFNQNPLFIDTANLDFRLDACSPAINAGVNQWFSDFGITNDYLDNPRLMGAQMDIGPIEMPALAWLADPSTTPSCEQTPTGSIEVAVDHACLPYEVQWSSDSATGTDLSNLPAGTYTVTLTDQKGEQLTQTVIINVLSLPIFDDFMVSNASCDTCLDGSIQYTQDPGSNVFTWSDGSIGTNLAGIMMGTYTCMVTNEEGCTTTYTFMIGVNHSTEPTELLTLDIWPNPGADYLSFELPPTSPDWQVQIIDVNGKIIATDMFSSGKHVISIERLPTGRYVFKASDLSHRRQLIKGWHKAR